MTVTNPQDMLSQFLSQQLSKPQQPDANPSTTAANSFASPLVPVERGALSKKRKLFSEDSTVVKSEGKKMKLQPSKNTGVFFSQPFDLLLTVSTFFSGLKGLLKSKTDMNMILLLN